MPRPEHIGRYRILRTLGRGAAGVVYLAHDPLIDREVAVKTLRRDLDESSDAEFRQRFLREARAVGRLTHPAIVGIYDVGDEPEQGEAFIAMEYLEGTTLKELLARGNRYDPERAVQLVATLAEALDYAHNMGVIHRDVKPGNIILTAGGGVKITDFGIARLDASDLTIEGTVMGTPNYMSPEQVRGVAVDRRSDLYSLGVILFELLTGSRPFRAGSLPELSLSITTVPAPDPRTLRPELPRDLAAIIMRCLAKDPGERFQSAAELARALRELDLEVTAPQPSDDQRLGYSTVTASPVGDATQPAMTANDLLTTRVTGSEELQLREIAGGAEQRWLARLAPQLHRRWFWPAVLFGVVVVAVAFGLVLGRPDRPALSTGELAPATFRTATPEPAADRTAPAPEAGAATADGTMAAPASPPAEATAEETSASAVTALPPTPTPRPPEATLEVVHENRLSAGFITLWLDGRKLWSEELHAKNVFKRMSGVAVHKSLDVVAGPHEIEVHISGTSMKVEARASIRADFDPGEARRLRVRLNPYTDTLKLAWEE